MQRKSTTLVALVAVLGGLLLLVLWSLQRRTSCTLDVDGPSERAVTGASAPSPAEVTIAPAARVAQVPVEPTPADASEAPTATLLLRGHVTLDGAPIEGGWVQLRSAQGEWQSRAVLDYEGRFRVAQVPQTTLVLSLELRPEALQRERTLLLPTLEIQPQAYPAELELAWTSKQLNVRVVDAEHVGLAARLELDGRGYDASADTDDDGLARLALIGAGRFQLRAVSRAGLRGAAEVELAEGQDLASVVIMVSAEER